MFQYFKIPYFTCIFFIKLTYNEYIGLNFLSHVVLRFSPVNSPSLTQKPQDHGTPNARNCWFILFYHVWGPTWINSHWNGIWGWRPGHIWLHTTLMVCDHTTQFWSCVGMARGHSLLGSHNFMVKALGSCVKWPSLPFYGDHEEIGGWIWDNWRIIWIRS
jgi:hypothetical protein